MFIRMYVFIFIEKRCIIFGILLVDLVWWNYGRLWFEVEGVKSMRKNLVFDVFFE